MVDVIQQSITPTTPPLAHGDAVLPDGLFPYLARDVSSALDQLARLNTDDRTGCSPTGSTWTAPAPSASRCARSRSRLRACLMMDAAMPAEVAHTGLRQSAMWLTRDADSILRERGRSGGWPDHEIDETLTTQRETFQKSPPGHGYDVEIPGMFHLNFTDAPSWTLALSGPIGGKRGHDIVAAYTVAFVDRFLNGAEAALLDDAPPWPDVSVDRS